MKKYIFIFALLICFVSCNEAKKTDETNTETQQTTTLKQKVEKFEAVDFHTKMEELQVYTIVDVRTPQEFAEASIPKAKNIDFNADSFEEELNKLEKDKPIFIYCKSGGRSAKAVEKAKTMGFERIIELDGGIESWKTANMELAHGM